MTFGGAPTRWEPPGESRGVALVAPGRAYSPSAPLLEFTRRALLQHGFTVQQIWWDTTTRSQDDPAEPWVRRHVEAGVGVHVVEPHGGAVLALVAAAAALPGHVVVGHHEGALEVGQEEAGHRAEAASHATAALSPSRSAAPKTTRFCVAT